MKGVTVFDEKSEITEKDVLNKIISADKILDGETRMYASGALAIIHPPENFNLPDLLFQINQVEKKSVFGRGDSLLIYLWLDTPVGYFFDAAGVLETTLKA